LFTRHCVLAMLLLDTGKGVPFFLYRPPWGLPLSRRSPLLSSSGTRLWPQSRSNRWGTSVPDLAGCCLERNKKSILASLNSNST
jgi:hypothetical protein